MNCEMCGAETSLINVIVEGVELNVCKKCASFGKVLRKPSKASVKLEVKKPIAKPQKEIVEMIVENYSEIIKEKREKMGLKQKELAKFLAERESLIHKMESGSHKPSIELAKKLEKQLSINLVDEKEIESQNLKTEKKTYTIGDMLKNKN
jgi:putative transcription factor